MKSMVVIAPHPDDETLGCGGTILRHVRSGDSVHWIIVTGMTNESGYSDSKISARAMEIGKVAQKYGFASTTQLEFPPKDLDKVPLANIIDKLGDCFNTIKPNIVLVPFRGDAHTDHRITFEAACACTKWFRFPSVEQVWAYETISETKCYVFAW